MFNEIAGSDKTDSDRYVTGTYAMEDGNEDEVRDHVEELVEGAINNINSAELCA